MGYSKRAKIEEIEFMECLPSSELREDQNSSYGFKLLIHLIYGQGRSQYFSFGNKGGSLLLEWFLNIGLIVLTRFSSIKLFWMFFTCIGPVE